MPGKEQSENTYVIVIFTSGDRLYELTKQERILSKLRERCSRENVSYSDGELMLALEGKGPIQCRFNRNWIINKEGRCERDYICPNERKDDLRCPLKLIEVAREVLEE